MNYIKKRGLAFKYAVSGLFESIRREAHMRIHVVSAVLAAGLSWFLNISNYEWLCIGFAIALVMITELINTAIERTCDLIVKEKNENVRYIKDISAAFVLLACLAAIVTAVIIFVPKLDNLF
jgi:diacylglycerol kinase (ATP)